MAILERYEEISKIIQREFSEIIISLEILYLPSGLAQKIRVYLVDYTFVDIWFSKKGRYSFHWEARLVRNVIYRFDNAPHKKWIKISTFPHHFHDRNDKNVKPSNLPFKLEDAIRAFFLFVRNKIINENLKSG
jgi:hypothetical protein